MEADPEAVETVVETEVVVGLAAEVWTAVVIVDSEVGATFVTDSAVDVVGGDDVDSEVEEAENDSDVTDDSVKTAEVDRVTNVETEEVKEEVVTSPDVVESERGIDEDTNEPDVVSVDVDSDVDVSVDSKEVKVDVESDEVDIISDVVAVEDGDDRDAESDVD